MMKRLLCIVSAMNTGGAETFLMKVYRNLNRELYQMDFCVNTNKNYYAGEIEALGGKIFCVPSKSRNPIKSFVETTKLVKQENYDYVIRVNEHSLSTIDLIAAKFGGAKVLIMRSSNASSATKLSIFLHKMFAFMPKHIPNVKLAPSLKAAQYTFGKKNIERGHVHLLQNGLDINAFQFSSVERDKYRIKFGIDDKFVVGHIGRFSKQKNHDFLINVFSEILKKVPNAILLLVGQGELEQDIRTKIDKLGISSNVMFMGTRSDVNLLLNAFDIFLFPSFYEGMPNTVIEAQCNGLPCLVSDTITDEVQVTNLVRMMSLEKDASLWAQSAMECYNLYNNRSEYAQQLKISGYDIKDCADKFTRLIFKAEDYKN